MNLHPIPFQDVPYSFHRIMTQNEQGDDYVVGDIHGAFDKLREHLDAIGFNPIKDRLFSVGDLVDRNAGSVEALQWLQQPFFHAVRGNHEDMYLTWRKDPSYASDYFQTWNGGDWVKKVDERIHVELERLFSKLPYILSVPLENNRWVAIVHADLPHRPVILKNGLGEQMLSRNLIFNNLVMDDAIFKEQITWNRQRINEAKMGSPYSLNRIEGYDLIVVGHTTIDEPYVLENFVYLDTGGWIKNRPFTIRKLSHLIQSTNQIASHSIKLERLVSFE